MITLKENQGSLYNDVKDFFEHIEAQNHCNDYKIQKWECNIEKGHGRTEKREYYLCSHLPWFENKDAWSNLNAIGMVRCIRKTFSGESIDTRYFISSLKDVQKAGKALRAHWGIENKLHWSFDVTFDEDYSRIGKYHAAQNTAILRKITMNLIKRAPEPVCQRPTKKKSLYETKARPLYD